MKLPGRQLEPGSAAPVRALDTVGGARVAVTDPERLVHLQFRRFAGCPVCHLHLRSVARRHAEIEAAGIREVVVFHSPEEELRPHLDDLPFAVVADPGKRLYAAFGVESSSRALLNPRVWWSLLRAVTLGAVAMLRGRQRPPVTRPNGGGSACPPTS